MEPSKAPPSPNPNAHNSNFTFAAPSASSSRLSKPRLAKVRKQNGAASFNPLRNSSVTFSKNDPFEQGIADQMRSLRIGSVNEVPNAKFGFGKDALAFGRSGYDKSVSSSGFDEIGNSSSEDTSKTKIEGRKNSSDHNIGVESEPQSALKTKLSVEEASGGDDRVPSDKHKEEGIGISETATSFQGAGGFFGMTKSDEFVFAGKKDDSRSPFVEFKTPPLKTNAFSTKNEHSGSTRMNKNRAKLKNSPTPLLHVYDLVLKERISPHSSETCSPMDLSPYQETMPMTENQCSRENSVRSNDSFVTALDSVQTNSNGPIDGDVNMATECLKMNDCEVAGRDTKEEISLESDCCGNKYGEDPQDESIKSANDKVDIRSDVTLTSAGNETSAWSSMESHDGDSMLHLGRASSLRNISEFHFTFAASSAAEAQSCSPKYEPKKKKWVKGGHDTYNSIPNIKVPNSSSSAAFSPFTETSALFASGQGQKSNLATTYSRTRDSMVNKEEGRNEGPASISAATIAPQEVCEKWRLKGNQAYKNGDLSMAEDYYTEGITYASKQEAPQSCCKALMLCYSNRAATRMSLGRMRDALQDCMLAAEIDPNFLRVQLRAANCYLALGEVRNASEYFKRCLQSGTASSVDQTISAEISDLLQKAQKISEYINDATELLQRRTTSDAEKALEHINESLMISSYSEKLLEMKAEALLMLCRYEEAIQLCDKTLSSAEKNSYPLDAGCRVADLDGSQLSRSFYFRLWRCSTMIKSCFHLGKLEEGRSFLEAQDKKVFSINKSGRKVLESLIPLAVTVHKLLDHKTAGNDAFKAGRHVEAVEHYTAALSCSVESRPFAAVCFCNRAAAYKALGQITDAIADCNLAIALDGKYLKALSRRADLYEMIRDYDQAGNDIRRVVSLLTKGAENKSDQLGISERSIIKDLKQNSIRLSELEEETRKGIPLDMYLTLGVESSASASVIKKAYRKAALRHHPDKAAQILARSECGDDNIWKDIAEEVHRNADRLFKIIGKAYEVLSDPTKKSQYDTEEDLRNSQQKRHGSNMARNNADTQHCSFEQSGSTRQWKESWRSYGDSSYKRF